MFDLPAIFLTSHSQALKAQRIRSQARALALASASQQSASVDAEAEQALYASERQKANVMAQVYGRDLKEQLRQERRREIHTLEEFLHYGLVMSDPLAYFEIYLEVFG